MERSDVLGVAARSTRRREEESRLLGLSEKTDLVFPFSDLDDSDPATARGFGRRPLLLGSTSLGDGEVSGGRFDSGRTGYGFPVQGKHTNNDSRR